MITVGWNISFFLGIKAIFECQLTGNFERFHTKSPIFGSAHTVWLPFQISLLTDPYFRNLLGTGMLISYSNAPGWKGGRPVLNFCAFGPFEFWSKQCGPCKKLIENPWSTASWLRATSDRVIVKTQPSMLTSIECFGEKQNDRNCQVSRSYWFCQNECYTSLRNVKRMNFLITQSVLWISILSIHLSWWYTL